MLSEGAHHGTTEVHPRVCWPLTPFNWSIMQGYQRFPRRPKSLGVGSQLHPVLGREVGQGVRQCSCRGEGAMAARNSGGCVKENARLLMERDILKKRRRSSPGALAVKYAFIRSGLSGYDLMTLYCCRVLEVSRSGYYAWLFSSQPACKATYAREEPDRQDPAGARREPLRLWQCPRSSSRALSPRVKARVREHRGQADESAADQGQDQKKLSSCPGPTDSAHDQPLARNLLNRQGDFASFSRSIRNVGGGHHLHPHRAKAGCTWRG